MARTTALLVVASLLVAVTLADARAAVSVHLSDDFEGYVKAPKPKPPVPVPVPVPELRCLKAHAVHAGDTCFDLAQAAGLTQDQFLSFNPNINCESIFVGQWVCLAATPNSG